MWNIFLYHISRCPTTRIRSFHAISFDDSAKYSSAESHFDTFWFCFHRLVVFCDEIKKSRAHIYLQMKKKMFSETRRKKEELIHIAVLSVQCHVSVLICPQSTNEDHSSTSSSNQNFVAVHSLVDEDPTGIERDNLQHCKVVRRLNNDRADSFHTIDVEYNRRYSSHE